MRVDTFFLSVVACLFMLALVFPLVLASERNSFMTAVFYRILFFFSLLLSPENEGAREVRWEQRGRG